MAESIITNKQVKPNGIITFTREITWLTFSVTGWGNGYVGLPEGHKYYGVDYDHIEIDAPGGLTYSCKEEVDGVEYWVVGFDSCHGWNTPENTPEKVVVEQTEKLYQSLA